ncbi:hypothetical protein [Sphingorhabdus sp.]|jgi:hypothetical protein|uniref:hypothetical protein n=1 Tax=Sphingorhabdus sp. TaxID=1902408 RepID=UPI0037C894B3
MLNPKMRGIVYATAAAALVTGCGADDIASPGTGGNITINNPAAPPPPPPPPPPTTVAAAGACPSIADPQGLTNAGTISGPTGTYRICQLPNLIKVSSSLPKLAGVLYSMNGRVNVGCDGGFTAPTAGSPVTSTTIGCTTPLTADTNVTLTIQPGVILYGATGQSWLAVNRGNKISAIGTASLPIIFTSQDNVAGFNADTSQGQWGGVVLMGRGVTTDCLTGTVAAGTCERDTEGSVDKAIYGGRDNAYNAGSMKYVQIRYSGFVLGSNKELQSLTAQSIGTGTTLEYIQSHNSSDDGVEFFGGAINMKYYVATGADDDSLDIDTGAQANIQFALLIQRAGKGDALLEFDSNGAETDTPRSKMQIANFTALQPQTSSDNEGSGGDLAATLFRGNSDTTLINGIIATPNNECIRMNGSGTTPATLVARSVVLQCNATKFLGSGSYTAAQVATSFGTGANGNNDAFTTSFSSLFINGANETAVVGTNPTTFSSFFTATTYIGAVKDASDTWYAGWTCNSATATLGTSLTGLCTSLPTY